MANNTEEEAMTHEEFREYEEAADKLCGECLNADGD